MTSEIIVDIRTNKSRKQIRQKGNAIHTAYRNKATIFKNAIQPIYSKFRSANQSWAKQSVMIYGTPYVLDFADERMHSVKYYTLIVCICGRRWSIWMPNMWFESTKLHAHGIAQIRYVAKSALLPVRPILRSHASVRAIFSSGL